MAISQTKQCYHCKEIKSVNCFSKDSTKPDGLHTYCKVCKKAKTNKPNPEKTRLNAKRWATKNPQKLRAMSIKRTYGLDWEQYIAMLEHQNYQCSICYAPLKVHKGIDIDADVPHVDHCHGTGKVRELLCDECNKGLGHFKDNPTLLREAAAYIEKHRRLHTDDF